MEEFHHQFFEESFFEERLCRVIIIKMVLSRSSRSISSIPRKVLEGFFSESLCDVRGLLVTLTLSVFSNLLFYLTTHGSISTISILVWYSYVIHGPITQMQRMDSDNNGNHIITEFSLTCCDSWLGLKAEENTVPYQVLLLLPLFLIYMCSTHSEMHTSCICLSTGWFIQSNHQHRIPTDDW